MYANFEPLLLIDFPELIINHFPATKVGNGHPVTPS
jgi:hypothetical protein